MGERKTRVVVEAQAKGFEKTQRAAKETFRTLGDGKKATKDFNQLDRAVGEVSQGLKGLRDAFRELDRGFKSREGKRALRDLREEVKLLAREMDALGGRRGGALIPALAGGAAGYMAGRMGGARAMAGRGVAAGQQAGGAVFSGSQGFAQGLAGIPIVGGFLAGQFQNLMATAGQGLAAREQRAGMMQYSSPFGLADRIAGARGAAGKRNRLFQVNEEAIAGAGQLAVQQRGKAAVEQVVQNMTQTLTEARGERPGGIFSAAPGTEKRLAEIRSRKELEGNRGLMKAVQRDALTAVGRVRSEGEAEERKRQEDMAASSRRRRRRAMNRAEAEERRKPFDVLVREGINMGIYDPRQARAFGGSLMAKMGGGLGQIQAGGGRNFYSQAAAAQSVYGLGADVTGAFGRAGRLGQIQGGLSGANRELVNAIAEGYAIGLEGSDLQQYMRQMADGIANFDRTGISIDPASMNKTAAMLRGRGVGGVRAGNIAGQFAGLGGKMQGGPQNAMQVQFMADVFGLELGGGMENYAASLRRAAGGDMTEGGVEKFINRMLEGAGGPGEKQLRLQTLFQNLGISGSALDAYDIATPSGAADAIRKEMNQRRSRAGKTPAEIMAESADPLLKKKAFQQYTKEGVGERMAGTALEFERGMVSSLRNFSKLAPELRKASTALANLATDGSARVVAAIERVEKLIGVYEDLKGINR